MPLAAYLFLFLAVVSVLSALMVIITKNPVYSVLYLIVTFFSIAGHYFLLKAEFLGVVHIIVYAGAIMVLFLYIVMMMNLNKEADERRKNIHAALIGIAAGVLLLSLVYAVKGAEAQMLPALQSADVGSIEKLGEVLFKGYMLPFEVASVLFLSAMVGAVFLSKKNLI
jgi:NADH-quinone oxidoreductase subunit J